jgi:hypothetical protein
MLVKDIENDFIQRMTAIGNNPSRSQLSKSMDSKCSRILHDALTKIRNYITENKNHLPPELSDPGYTVQFGVTAEEPDSVMEYISDLMLTNTSDIHDDTPRKEGGVYKGFYCLLTNEYYSVSKYYETPYELNTGDIGTFHSIDAVEDIPYKSGSSLHSLFTFVSETHIEYNRLCDEVYFEYQRVHKESSIRHVYETIMHLNTIYSTILGYSKRQQAIYKVFVTHINRLISDIGDEIETISVMTNPNDKNNARLAYYTKAQCDMEQVCNQIKQWPIETHLHLRKLTDQYIASRDICGNIKEFL